MLPPFARAILLLEGDRRVSFRTTRMTHQDTITLPGTTVEPATAAKRVLICARCSHEITTEEARVVRGGAHRHSRINPKGWVHEFGCFALAPGCRAEGEATTFFTWFPGYAWRLALCASCTTHLGWRFDGELGSFFGLLIDRVV
jgi:hypothetical protein